MLCASALFELTLYKDNGKITFVHSFLCCIRFILLNESIGPIQIIAYASSCIKGKYCTHNKFVTIF